MASRRSAEPPPDRLDEPVTRRVSAGIPGATPAQRKLLALWAGAAEGSGTRTPTADAIMSAPAKAIAFFSALGAVHVVEQRGGDPLDFTFRLWATAAWPAPGLRLTGRRVGDVQILALRDLMRRTYATREPLFQTVSGWIAGRRVAPYTRLLLPLGGGILLASEDGGG
jgi:hypothetical protein